MMWKSFFGYWMNSGEPTYEVRDDAEFTASEVSHLMRMRLQDFVISADGYNEMPDSLKAKFKETRNG